MSKGLPKGTVSAPAATSDTSATRGRYKPFFPDGWQPTPQVRVPIERERALSKQYRDRQLTPYCAVADALMGETIDRLGGDVGAAARSIALALAGILTEGGTLPEGATSRAEIVMSAVLAALRPDEQQAGVA